MYMAKIAFLFPGQGSQQVGMAAELCEHYPEARAVLQEVDDALNQKLSRLMRDGPIEELTLTQNAQPALMAASIATLRVLEKQLGKPIHQIANYVAGHSLGEYSALAAIGVLSLNDTAKLLKLRGEAMQRAVPQGVGAMAAILGLEMEALEAVVQQTLQAPENNGEILAIANDNGGGQIVISGHAAAVERAMLAAKEKGAKRALPLPVSAPFHCELMRPAAKEMEIALAAVNFAPCHLPIITNVTADAESHPNNLRNLLVDQVCGRVRWRESMIKLASLETFNLVELGSGKVLSGLAKRIDPRLEAVAAGDLTSMENLLKQLG